MEKGDKFDVVIASSTKRLEVDHIQDENGVEVWLDGNCFVWLGNDGVVTIHEGILRRAGFEIKVTTN